MEHVYTKEETKRAVAWCSWQKWGKRGEPSASRRINPKDRVVLSILSSRIPAASDRERKRKARANIESVDVDPILSFKIYVKRETALRSSSSSVFASVAAIRAVFSPPVVRLEGRKRDGEVSRGASDEALLILLIHFIELPEL